MTRTGRAYAAGAAALVLALAGACGATAEPAAPRTPAPVQASWRGCEATGAFVDPGYAGDAAPPQGGVPAGFAPTTVVLCEQGEQTDTHGDTVSVDLERTSGDLGALLSYLARPDEGPTGGACTADGWLRPWLFLLDDSGHYVAPAIPVDGCGKPLGWYGDRDRLPWTSLPYTDRVVRTGEVTETAQARATGCAMAAKDVVDVYATSSHALPGRFPRDPFAGRALTVCVYEVPASDRGTDAPPGDFVAGHRLDAREQSAVVAALLAAPAAAERCGTANARFANVAPADGGPVVSVELDGCRRVVSDGDGTPVVRAGDDLLALLGG